MQTIMKLVSDFKYPKKKIYIYIYMLFKLFDHISLKRERKNSLKFREKNWNPQFQETLISNLKIVKNPFEETKLITRRHRKIDNWNQMGKAVKSTRNYVFLGTLFLVKLVAKRPPRLCVQVWTWWRRIQWSCIHNSNTNNNNIYRQKRKNRERERESTKPYKKILSVTVRN